MNCYLTWLERSNPIRSEIDHIHIYKFLLNLTRPNPTQLNPS